MKFTFQWLWFDLWIGAFLERKSRTLYVCPFPTVVLRFEFPRKLLRECPNCHARVPSLGKSTDGREFCCIHCAFNLCGCRCRHGEFGQPETEYYPPFDWEDDDIIDPTNCES